MARHTEMTLKKWKLYVFNTAKPQYLNSHRYEPDEASAAAATILYPRFRVEESKKFTESSIKNIIHNMFKPRYHVATGLSSTIVTMCVCLLCKYKVLKRLPSRLPFNSTRTWTWPWWLPKLLSHIRLINN